MVQAFDGVTQTLPTSIKEATVVRNALPDGLFETVENLSSFEF
jgi:hypothetical protein